MGFLQHFELERPSNCKLIVVYRAEALVVPQVLLKEVAHGLVCLSESHRGLNFRDVICARRYRPRAIDPHISAQLTKAYSVINC